MRVNKDRRSTNRINLSRINNVCRQCDVAALSGKGELDITIVDISQQGMKLSINCDEDRCKISPLDEIFIRGCIFNDRIGFLSSQKAVTVWKEAGFCGVRFVPQLEFAEPDILAMLS
ncbi:pilus assembly protein PilZ [Maridesulfovibrio sp.]|uniref:pilus assembly protein PilZ n=1 Tax=Maridesulfovibrio sp. TaxID=2795000 RepID=UPI002A1886CA|nr:pilus assembly protein PilZ [Maridesulfovibrio sp.]